MISKLALYSGIALGCYMDGVNRPGEERSTVLLETSEKIICEQQMFFFDCNDSKVVIGFESEESRAGTITIQWDRNVYTYRFVGTASGLEAVFVENPNIKHTFHYCGTNRILHSRFDDAHMSDIELVTLQRVPYETNQYSVTATAINPVTDDLNTNLQKICSTERSLVLTGIYLAVEDVLFEHAPVLCERALMIRNATSYLVVFKLFDHYRMLSIKVAQNGVIAYSFTTPNTKLCMAYRDGKTYEILADNQVSHVCTFDKFGIHIETNKGKRSICYKYTANKLVLKHLS